jgi:hypothetical protein
VVRESAFPGVGGFSFTLLGSPFGHCYQAHAGSLSWAIVSSSDIMTPEYRRFEETGTAHYEYTMVETCRGAGVAGAFLPQIGLGFIYSPLEPGERLEPGLVLRRSGVTLRALCAEVSQIAAKLVSPDELMI